MGKLGINHTPLLLKSDFFEVSLPFSHSHVFVPIKCKLTISYFLPSFYRARQVPVLIKKQGPC